MDSRGEQRLFIRDHRAERFRPVWRQRRVSTEDALLAAAWAFASRPRCGASKAPQCPARYRGKAWFLRFRATDSCDRKASAGGKCRAGDIRSRQGRRVEGHIPAETVFTVGVADMVVISLQYHAGLGNGDTIESDRVSVQAYLPWIHDTGIGFALCGGAAPTSESTDRSPAGTMVSNGTVNRRGA